MTREEERTANRSICANQGWKSRHQQQIATKLYQRADNSKEHHDKS